ncbi:MAG: hypothetical protein WC266_03860 [Patescibacteria group bacterium]
MSAEQRLLMEAFKAHSVIDTSAHDIVITVREETPLGPIFHLYVAKRVDTLDARRDPPTEKVA